MSIIVNLVNNISGGVTVLYDKVKMKDLVNRSHALKHLHGRIIFGPFERCFHEGSLWRVQIAVISFIITKQTFFHFFCYEYRFYK